jgi:hypothetical protein
MTPLTPPAKKGVMKAALVMEKLRTLQYMKKQRMEIVRMLFTSMES